MNSLPSSSLEPLEDRFSIVLSRLERIEASLAELKDVKKLLVEIEDNTHPDGDNKCDFRNNALEKVSFQIIKTFLIKDFCMNKALLKKKTWGKMLTYYASHFFFCFPFIICAYP